TVRPIKPAEEDTIDRVIGRGPSAPERATRFASAGAAASLARAASKRSLASDFDVDAKSLTEQKSLGKGGYKGARSAAGDYRQLVGAAKQDLSTYDDPQALVAGRKAGALSGASNAFRVDHSAETAPPSGLKEAANFPVARVHEIARENARKGIFSANPPVNAILDDQRRQEQLRAAAISMARAMVKSRGSASQQFHSAEQAALHERPLTLHNAALKRARQQVDRADDLGTAMREWYIGPEEGPAMKFHKTISLPWKKFQPSHAVDQRARTDTESGDFDAEKLIRRDVQRGNAAQRSSVQRSKDRAALMAIAQENVNKTMFILDEEVCVKTGKPSGALLADAGYRERRWSELESRRRTPDIVAIGGGKAVHVDEVEDLARDRLESEINEIEAAAREREEEAPSTASSGSYAERRTAKDDMEDFTRRAKSWMSRFRLQNPKTAAAHDADSEGPTRAAGSTTDETNSQATSDTASDYAGSREGETTGPLKRFSLNRLLRGRKAQEPAQGAGAMEPEEESQVGTASAVMGGSTQPETEGEPTRPIHGVKRFFNLRRLPGFGHEAEDEASKGTSAAAAGPENTETETESTVQRRKSLFSGRKTSRKGKSLSVENVPEDEEVGSEYIKKPPPAAREAGVTGPNQPTQEDDDAIEEVPSALRDSRFHEEL
ncbi:hypothetical protein KEM54_006786, partial [Ascosphaera aggregata]